MTVKKFFIDHWKEISSAATTILAGAGWAWRRFLRHKVARWRKHLALLEKLPAIIGESDDMKAEIAKLQRTADEIIKQLKPNGGTSVFDTLIRLEQGIHDLRQSRWTLEDISGSAFWQTDASGRTVYASSALADLMGLDQKDVLGNGWVAAICAEDRNRVYQEWLAAVNQGRRFDDTYQIVRPNRTMIAVNARALPVTDTRGQITGYIGILQAINQV